MSNKKPSDFPLPLAPDTWALNDVHLDILNDFTKRWAQKGYAWKFGLEINFKVRTAKGNSDTTKNEYDLAVAEATHAARFVTFFQNELPYIMRLHERGDFTQARQGAIDRMIAVLHDGSIDDGFFAAIGHSRADIENDLRDFAAKLESEDDETRVRAVRSIYLAKLHLLPLAEGGLRDVIDPRFGNYIGAVGWFDCSETDCEVRLHPQPDTAAFINAYHRAINTMQETGVELGTLISLDYTHMHFSVTEIASGINVMESEAPAHVDMRSDLMRGIVYFLTEYAALYNDHDITQQTKFNSLAAGTTRTRGLRQRAQTWEYRGYKGSGIVHLARDMGLMMLAGYTGLYATAKDDTPLLRDIVPQPQRKPVVSGPNGTHVSGFQSTLEHCIADDDGTLHADPSATEWNHELLLLESGLSPEDDSNVTHIGDTAYDLNTTEGWDALIGTLKTGADGRIVTPDGMDPEIAAALAPFTVTGYRTAFDLHLSTNTIGFATYQGMPDKLARPSLFSKVAGRKNTRAVHAFYETYTKDTKPKEIAALSAFRIADTATRTPDDIGRSYTNLWDDLINPPAMQIAAHIIRDIDQRKSKRWRVQRETLCREQSLLTALAPHFDAAFDDELDYRRKSGEASNTVVAALEDARRDIAHFTQNPRGMISQTFNASASVFANDDATDVSGTWLARLSFAQTYLVFLLILADKDVALSDARKHVNEAPQWMDDAIAKAVADHPNIVENKEFQDFRALAPTYTAKAVQRLNRIINAFEAGKPASLQSSLIFKR